MFLYGAIIKVKVKIYAFISVNILKHNDRIRIFTERYCQTKVAGQILLAGPWTFYSWSLHLDELVIFTWWFNYIIFSVRTATSRWPWRRRRRCTRRGRWSGSRPPSTTAHARWTWNIFHLTSKLVSWSLEVGPTMELRWVACQGSKGIIQWPINWCTSPMIINIITPSVH